MFPLRNIKCLTGDREFIGQAWFEYLLDKTISFRMRIRANIMVTNASGVPVAARNLFRMLKPGEWTILDGRRTVCGVRLHAVGLRLPNSEYLILVTDSDPGAGAGRLQGTMGNRDPVRLLEDARIRFRMHPCRRAGKSSKTAGSDGHRVLLVRRHRQMDEFHKGNQDKEARSEGDQPVSTRTERTTGCSVEHKRPI